MNFLYNEFLYLFEFMETCQCVCSPGFLISRPTLRHNVLGVSFSSQRSCRKMSENKHHAHVSVQNRVGNPIHGVYMQKTHKLEYNQLN